MNNRFFLIFPLLLASALSFAQIEFGVKAGLSTGSLQGESFTVNRAGSQDLRVALEDADYGFQFGALLRLPLSPNLTLQPEVTFNSSKNSYQLDDDDTGISTAFEERYNDVNVPVLFSYKLAFLQLNAGPVGHFFLSSTDDLNNRAGLERTFETFNLGYALGAGIDIGPLTFDVRYDGNFSRYGETFTFQGEEYNWDQAPKRWIGSVAYRF